MVFASSFPMIAASCENKNPTDENIINNTTPQTQGNQNQENPSGSDNSSSNTNSQTQDKQKQENKNKEEKPNGSGNSSSNTNSQTQDKQKQEDKGKEEKKDNPKDLLKQLEEIKKDYEELKKQSNYFDDDLKIWFENAVAGSTRKWNFYLDFKSKVENNHKIGPLKYVKDFIEKYNTIIKKNLQKNKRS
ncbi:hypothetical protein MbovBow_03815 [Mycoplasmopsis bovis]